jgi:carnitine-CoA ligase
MLPHGYYLRAGIQVGHWLELTADDRYLAAMPLFHAAARMMIVGAMLRAGGSAVIEPAFHPSQLLDRARATDATIIGGVGAMGMALLAQPPRPDDRDHGLRLASFIPMRAEDRRALEDRLGVPLNNELYGQTECVPMTCTPMSVPRNPDSDGGPAPDIDLVLLDDDDREVGVGEVGEICIRPRERYAMFRGYWRKPEATLEAFRGLWYHTGDYGRRDQEGFISFVDRKKDALRRRGENVSSMELETAILQHPKVAEVAIHAVPSELTEDEIKACIVVAPGEQLTPEEAFAFFKERLPYFAMPRYVELMDELPRNAVSRVMKHKLRELGVNERTWDLDALGFTVSREERR